MSDGTTVHDNPKPIQLKNISDVKEAYVVERSIIALTNGGNQASIETEMCSLIREPERFKGVSATGFEALSLAGVSACSSSSN